MFTVFAIFTVVHSAFSIVGGQRVQRGDIVARSTVGLQGGCSGTLITRRHVLTAAHCVEYGGRESILFGFSFQNSRAIRVVDKVVHRGYRGMPDGFSPRDPARRPVHDIAILKMAQDAPRGYQPANIGLRRRLQKGERLILAGYGVTNPRTHRGAGVLRKVDTVFNRYNRTAVEIIFGPTPGKSACMGDSGGPMYVQEGQQLNVVGVTSRGFPSLGPCSGNGNYADVEAHRNWIQNAISRLR